MNRTDYKDHMWAIPVDLERMKNTQSLSGLPLNNSQKLVFTGTQLSAHNTNEKRALIFANYEKRLQVMMDNTMVQE
jgi:hypothetical protein